MIAVAHGTHANALHVRACARLGDADGADQLAARHARQPALFLLFGAVIQHVMRADAVHALAEAGETAPAEFLVQQRLVAEIAATATVLGRHVHAQEAGRADLAPRFLVDVMLLAPLRVERQHFRFDVTRNRLAQHAQVVVHPGGFVRLHGVFGSGELDGAVPARLTRKGGAARWSELDRRPSRRCRSARRRVPPCAQGTSVPSPAAWKNR